MILAADLEAWRGYLARLEAEYAEHTGENGRVWLESFTGGSSFERAFTGPWSHIRAHVTTEFRQWIEEYDVERLTLSQWVVRQRADREKERLEYLDWLDSQPF